MTRVDITDITAVRVGDYARFVHVDHPTSRVEGEVTWYAHGETGANPYLAGHGEVNPDYWTFVSATRPERKPVPVVGTAGTATVLYGGDLRRAAPRTVFRTAGVVAPGKTTRPWVDELGNLLMDDEVTDFVPDDAQALRAEVARLGAAFDDLTEQWRAKNAEVERWKTEAEALAAKVDRLMPLQEHENECAYRRRAERAEAEVGHLLASLDSPTHFLITPAGTVWHHDKHCPAASGSLRLTPTPSAPPMKESTTMALSKRTVLLDFLPTHSAVNAAFARPDDDEGEGVYGPPELYMSGADHQAMGEPQQVTVTIEPGDKLNGDQA